MIDWIKDVTGASRVELGERIQSLWSGYGEIRRVHLEGAAADTMIAKRIEPPTALDHPRGWNTNRSHERKLHSYEVERAFYDEHAAHSRARVPRTIATREEEQRWLLLLEDLDAAGFTHRKQDLRPEELDACLAWLAGFHASFLSVAPHGLWDVGTYWHLATRPDELLEIRDERLVRAAPILDAKLNAARFQTFVHGDAKVANFCFPDRPGDPVAAVDFQYVGGGCGIKDVAYFLSSCMTEVECEAQAPRHLDTYFDLLRASLADRTDVDIDHDALEAEWRALYPIAWADFYRFLAGWAPDHWKIHGYSDRLTREVLDEIL